MFGLTDAHLKNRYFIIRWLWTVDHVSVMLRIECLLNPFCYDYDSSPHLAVFRYLWRIAASFWKRKRQAVFSFNMWWYSGICKKKCLCYPHQSGMQADNLIIIHITLTKRCSNTHLTQGKLDQIGLQCFPPDTERERRFPGENNVG